MAPQTSLLVAGVGNEPPDWLAPTLILGGEGVTDCGVAAGIGAPPVSSMCFSSGDR